MPDDPPASVRIRTGGENEHRFRSIERACEVYDVNKSDAIAYACNDICELVPALRRILNREDLTLEQRREIAETIDAATRGLDVDVDLEVGVDPNR